MKLPYTEMKFYPKVKSQTGLSSLRVSCKHALRTHGIWAFYHFLNKTGCQKNSALVPWGQMMLFILMCFQVAEIHLFICKCLKSSIFQEKQCYISNTLLILKAFLTSNDLFILKIICRRKFYKIFYHPTKILNLTFLSLFLFFKDTLSYTTINRVQ